MNKPEFKLITLDVDGSIAAQPELYRQLDAVAPLNEHLDNLRLWANPKGLTALREQLQALRQAHPEPWLTFIGSGDLHHLTLALLETLPQSEPYTLVLIDNHPDWFCEQPTFHCGNWVSGALKLPNLQAARLVAQDSEDLKGRQFWTSPWQDLCSGRVTINPYRRQYSLVPLKWENTVRGVSSCKKMPWGTEMQYQTVAAMGERAFFDQLAHELRGQRIYLSIDKDSLLEDAALTDWEQGQLSLAGLLHGIRRLVENCNVIGIDVCGERSPSALNGLVKRLDAGRFQNHKVPAAVSNQLNEQTNLSIVNAVCPTLEPLLSPV